MADNRNASASVVADLRALVGSSEQSRKLKALDPVGALEAKRGRADYKAPSTGGGGGITGPLTEILNEDGSSTRVYYEHTTNLYSNDYLLAVEVSPLKTLFTHDGDGNLLQINFAKPTIES